LHGLDGCVLYLLADVSLEEGPQREVDFPPKGKHLAAVLGVEQQPRLLLAGLQLFQGGLSHVLAPPLRQDGLELAQVGGLEALFGLLEGRKSPRAARLHFELLAERLVLLDLLLEGLHNLHLAELGVALGGL
jgi:hypothetical protein